MSRAVKVEGGAGDFRGEGRVRSLTRMTARTLPISLTVPRLIEYWRVAQLIAHGQPQTCMTCAGKTRVSLEAERGEE